MVYNYLFQEISDIEITAAAFLKSILQEEEVINAL
jgi:hypothetical protein